MSPPSGARATARRRDPADPGAPARHRHPDRSRRAGRGRDRPPDPRPGRPRRRWPGLHRPDDESGRFGGPRTDDVRRVRDDRGHRRGDRRRARQRRARGLHGQDAGQAAPRSRRRGPPDRRRRLRRPRPARGTGGDRQPRRLVQPDGDEPRGAGADAAGLHRQCGPRAADAVDESAGLPRGAPRRRDHRGSRDLRVTPRGSRPARPAVAIARRARRRRRRSRAPGAPADRPGGRRPIGGRARPTGHRPGRAAARPLTARDAACAGQPRSSRPGPREPPVERRPLHPARRHGQRPRRAPPRRPPRVDREHVRAHPARRSRPRIRTLLPGREVARPRPGRGRDRPGDRQAAGRGGRRTGRGGIGRRADAGLVQPACRQAG